MTEIGQIFGNERVQAMFFYVLKNFRSVELSLSLFESLIKQNLASSNSEKFLTSLQ